MLRWSNSDFTVVKGIVKSKNCKESELIDKLFWRKDFDLLIVGVEDEILINNFRIIEMVPSEHFYWMMATLSHKSNFRYPHGEKDIGLNPVGSFEYPLVVKYIAGLAV